MIFNPLQHSIETLPFIPPRGLANRYIQTILPFLFSTQGEECPYKPYIIQLEDGDSLFCKMSTPPNWKTHQKTILILHGLGGTDASDYMIRMSRKFYQAGYRSLRINLRGSGQGLEFAQRPYHAGLSHDILQLVQTLNRQDPQSQLVLIGYSLGGNVVLKLLGELGERSDSLIETAIAICSPIDLAQSMKLLSKRSNQIFHYYYVNRLRRIGSRWIGNRTINSIVDFDNIVIAPIWGYRDAWDYYCRNSSISFLPSIRNPCHLIFAADDPFVNYPLSVEPLSSKIKIWLSQYGGHMGFWGWAGKEHGYNWLDGFLLKLVNSEQIFV